MAECEYWWRSAGVDWCQITKTTCTCGGREENCTLKGKPIDAALLEEENATLEETANRERRRRSRQEAS